MKKEIKSDIYEIVNRLKKIDKGYFVLYNNDKKLFELHHKLQKPTYLISLYDKLDRRSVVKTYNSLAKNSLQIFKEIEKTNNKLESYAHKIVFDKAKQNLKESLHLIQYF